MNLNNVGIQSLLGRTAISSPFETFLRSLEQEYQPIGKIKIADPILEGYEAANFKLETDKGQYVLKIFEANRQKENIDSLIKVLVEAPKIDVPVPALVQGANGDLSTFTDGDKKIFYYITELFRGENFEHKVPSLEEIKIVTTHLAALNTLDFPVVEAYDSWGNKNLVQEFEKNTIKLSPAERQLVESIVNNMRDIDLQRFSKGVIHGDMQRKHVIKSDSGAYCIIDFGCMSNDAKIIDLSVYLAWFCLSKENRSQWGNIQQSVLEEYTKKHHLLESEVRALPVLIRASYATYFMTTSILIRQGDKSGETKQWNINAKEMLLSF